jgi:hypothetical protein
MPAAWTIRIRFLPLRMRMNMQDGEPPEISRRPTIWFHVAPIVKVDGDHGDVGVRSGVAPCHACVAMTQVAETVWYKHEYMYPFYRFATELHLQRLSMLADNADTMMTTRKKRQTLWERTTSCPYSTDLKLLEAVSAVFCSSRLSMSFNALTPYSNPPPQSRT